MRISDRFFKTSSIGLLWLWLGIFAVIPFATVIVISLLTPGEGKFYTLPFTLSHYGELFNPLYLRIFARSLLLAFFVTAVCLALGYPFAYFLTMVNPKLKPILLALMIIPFWTSSLIRTYAIAALLKAQGPLNTLLIHLGFISHPMQLLYTQVAVFIGLVYSLLPYMILPLYANIDKCDKRFIDAAYDLGAGPIRTLFKIVIPITLPGIISGSILVFLPAMTLFYIPDILGGARSILLGNLISTQFLSASNWPFGATLSVALTILLVLMLLILKFVQSQRGKKS